MRKLLCANHKDYCTREEWKDIMYPFIDLVKGRAANLAAHGWDVAIVDGELLIASAFQGGDWMTQDGDIYSMTLEEYDAYYPPMSEEEAFALKNTPEYKHSSRQPRQISGVWRNVVIQFDEAIGDVS